MALRVIAFALTLAALPASAEANSEPAETPHAEFVSEYIRELNGLERLRSAAEVDLQKPGANPFGEMIHLATRMQIELDTDISVMQHMRLSGQFAELPGQIAEHNRMKKLIYGRMSNIATEMVSGPKPGVDYGSLAAKMPALRAQMESIDESYIQLSTLAFLSLIDQRPDKQGHVSHLLITKSERRALLDTLHRDFGSEIEHASSATAIVNSAGVLQDGLRKPYLCSDDPW